MNFDFEKNYYEKKTDNGMSFPAVMQYHDRLN